MRTGTPSIRAAAAAAAAFLVLMAGPAAAVGAGRHVVVNGKRLSDAEIRVLERVSCGPVADGRYWLADNGIWGAVGHVRPLGHIESACYDPPARTPRAPGARDGGR